MTRNRQRDYVKASELAQLGACERVVWFQARLGRRETEEQEQAVRRGLREHEVFYAESLAIAASSEKKGQCFIATLTLGTTSETLALRAYRDLVLRRSQIGRRFISAYYRCGPVVCGLLRRHPALQRPVRAILRRLARFATRAVAQIVKQAADV